MSMCANNFSTILSNYEYKQFSQILSKLSDCCSDVDIVDGKICQRTDHRDAIVKCDLSKIFKFKNEYVFINIWENKNKFKKLKSKLPVNIYLNNNMFTITDGINSVDILSGSEASESNQFFSDNRFSKFLTIGAPLLRSNLSNSLCSSIFKAIVANKAYYIGMQLKTNNLNLLIERPRDPSKTQSFTLNHELLLDIGNFKIFLPFIAFSFIPEMTATLEIFLNPNQKQTLNIVKCPMSENILLEIYTRSHLRTTEDDYNELTN